MNTFTSVYRLTSLIEAATNVGFGLSNELLANYNRARLQPVVLAEYEHEMTIPTFGSTRELNVKQIRYCRKYLTAFSCSREYLGQEGKGMYGIGLYREGAAPRWCCEAILFDKTGAPLLIEGKEAALEVAAKEAQLRDKSSASDNETAIRTSALMDGSVLNALLGALMRAEPETTPAIIGVRLGKIQLVLEDDEEGGRGISVPKGKFLCRDDAAGALLQAIEHAASDARRGKSVLSQENEPFFRLAPC